MSAISGVTSSMATALVATTDVAGTFPALPRRGVSRTTPPTALDPDDAAFTIIDPPARYTAARHTRRRSTLSGRVRGNGSRVHLGALQAYAPYHESVGLYVDLWV